MAPAGSLEEMDYLSGLSVLNVDTKGIAYSTGGFTDSYFCKTTLRPNCRVHLTWIRATRQQPRQKPKSSLPAPLLTSWERPEVVFRHPEPQNVKQDGSALSEGIVQSPFYSYHLSTHQRLSTYITQTSFSHYNTFMFQFH